MTGFFTDNYDAINSFSDRLDKFSPQSQTEKEVASLVRAAIKAVTFNREEYDHLTPYSSVRQAKGLLETLQAPIDEQSLRRVLLSLATFIREATLVRESRSDSEQTVLDHFLGQVADGDDWAGYYEDFLRFVLPNKLFESNYREIDRARLDTKKFIEDTKTGAEDLKDRIEGYRSELKNLASEFNFVGLSHAFRGLLGDKKKEKWWTFAAVVMLAILALGTPLLYILNSDEGFLIKALGDGWSPKALAHLVGGLGVEIILLYFFRITLKTYLLARDQITNLQLRVALCTFIEGYLDFASKAQNLKVSSAIQGFEALTFATLPMGDTTLPSTLEGLEQVTKLVQAAKG